MVLPFKKGDITMAHKAKSFKLTKDKKTKKDIIVIYTNVEEPGEKALVDYYLNAGFMPMFEEKKPTKTVAEMRKELEADKNALKAFDDAYSEKGGFFKACKIYSDWKKAHK